MVHLRRLTPTGRRLLMAALALALFVRALVPAGWMPSPGGGLMLCDGMAPAATAPMAAHAHGRHDASPVHPGKQQPTTADHSCAFAGPVAALDAPTLAAPLPPARPAALPSRTRVAVRVGQGLAAPPPPPTGPPFLV